MNEYLVLALDALLHLASIFLMAVLVSFIVKIFSRAHVDFRLVSGLFIIFMLTVVKMFLERRIAEFLPGVTPDLLFGLMAVSVLITAITLIYWQYAVPLLGSLCSAIVVVGMLFGTAFGVPKLSLHLMPEGQRFAEYAGFASEQTAQLMEQAKNFKKRADDPTIWQKALSALTFFTSKDEKENLSRDFASGIEVYKERKRLMDSMTDEELAEYRQAMAEFLEEQGLAENRYSLNNLKNAKPEDLANLGSFMRELNGEFGIDETGDIPEESIPSSADSIRQISQNLQNAELSEREQEIFNNLLHIVGTGELEVGLEKARAELLELKKSLPKGRKLFSNLADIQLPKDKWVGHKRSEERIDFIDTTVIDEIQEIQIPTGSLLVEREGMDELQLIPDRSNYSSKKIGVWVLQLPVGISQQEEWERVAESIPYRAWFTGKGSKPVTKLILEDIVLNVGDSWQFRHEDNIYIMQFDKVTEEGIFIAAVKKL